MINLLSRIGQQINLGGPGSGPRPGELEGARYRAVDRFGPVIAEAKQAGYTQRIHDSHPENLHGNPADIEDESRPFDRSGTMTIESPKGEIVQGGGWMDWKEKHYPENYKSLSKPQRASMELEEQKKYGYAHGFKFHKGISEHGLV